MQVFANNAYSSLGASLSNSATSLTLATATGIRFPSPTGGSYFLLTLVGLDSNGNENAWEIVKVTGRASDALTIVRAQESTTAVAWAAGTRVELRATAGTFSSYATLAAPTFTGGITVSSGGASITGNTSVAGDVSATGAISGSAAGVRLPTASPVYFNAGFTTYIQEVSAGVLQFVVGGTDVTHFSSTGLAVAGSVSATGASSNNQLILERTGSATGKWGIYTHSNSLFFNDNVASADRMVIDASGNLLVNTTSQIGPGKANIAYNGGTHYGLTIKETAGGTGAQFVTFYNSAGSAIGNIYNPTTTTIGYATSSDYRLKENIQPMVGAIERIKRLRPVTYTWAADGKPGEGFIAHELAEVCPDAVVGEKDAVRQETYEVSPAVPAVLDEDGREVSPAIPGVTETRTVPVYQGIDVSFLVGLLAAGMQELHAVVLEQADRIKALEARA